jgi:peptidyl-prolyl cis-trans isomerase B (cyclophilin B)
LLNVRAEEVPKGASDRPKEDVIIVDSGELEVEPAVNEEGKQVPMRAEEEL